ncbi:MAG: shikimate dehydrogenase [Pirellulaceae bacterium]
MPDSAIQEIVCCFGNPMAGNPTQFVMQRALADLRLDWRCLTLEVAAEDLEDAVRGIRAFGFKGASLDLPHKVAVVPYLDRLTEFAEKVGAVNCICRVDYQLVGENTDGPAFLQSLKNVVGKIDQQRILMLGAGGTARSIAVELAEAGVGEIRIADGSAEQAQALVERIHEHVPVSTQVISSDAPLEIDEDIDILINATSIGHLDPDAEIPIKTDTIQPSLLVADVVINPPSTWLLREAAARGCTTFNGLDMFVNQAILNFKLWSGHDPNPAVMREAVEEFLEV